MSDVERGARTLVAAAALGAVVFGAATAVVAVPPEPSEVRRSAVTDQELDFTVTTDEPVYAPGESVRARITVVNRSESTIQLDFSSGQRYDFVVRDAGGESLWQWSALMAFAQMLGEERLSAGDSLSYDEQLGAALAPGSYSVEGSLVAINRPLRASATFTVR